jgi:Fur family ferric uptake transcriptional regulator
MTNQRRIILEELGKVTSHPTADQVYQMVRRRVPRISLGTVYRNLETLSQCGVILKLELGGSQRRFDGDISPHYHVRCQGCGQVRDLPADPMPEIEHRLRSATNFTVTGHRLELVGICPACRAESRTNQPQPANIL